ncbi:MAG: LamG domain-containing protein, partial [Candidatus Dojkabacteria bacterium]|nr:LamG domain-containing protein [Candidatus Dojkabacteria bacterium]
MSRNKINRIFFILLLSLIFIPLAFNIKASAAGSYACPYDTCAWPCDENSNCQERSELYQTCCTILRCNCGTASDPCWRGSIYYPTCSLLCDALGDDCPTGCTYSCACPSGYSTTQPSGDYITTTQTGQKSDCSNCTATCYKSCPTGSCALYEDPNDLIWQDDNPGTGRSATLTVPVSDPPEGCPTTTPKTCYTTNSQPQLENITIDPETYTSIISILFSNPRTNLFTEFVGNVLAVEPTLEVLGYTSDDHSGTELNNMIKVTATYSDADGADDIKAVYVWWSPESKIGVEEATTDYLYPTTETGLRRYYPMDETSGSTVADVASNANATASGTTITSGKSNNARSFDGSNDYINTYADIDYGTGTQITVAAWVKFTTCTGTDNICYIVSKNQYNSGTAYSLLTTSSGSIRFNVMGLAAQSVDGFNDNNWHYVVGVLNGTTASVYVDGGFEGSKTVSPANNDQYVIIGGDDATSTYRPFNGTIDEVSIYNVALTESQILEKYESGYTEASTTVLTPNKIDITKDPQVDDTSSFGFMVTTDGNVYVPHITSLNDRVWTEPNSYINANGNTVYYISDTIPTSEHPDYDRMVELSNISISTISANQVQL